MVLGVGAFGGGNMIGVGNMGCGSGGGSLRARCSSRLEVSTKLIRKF